MSGLFKCGEPCNRSFADSRGLSHHRNSCSIYIQRQSENRLKASQTSGSKRKSLHRLLPDSKRARNLPILTTADQPTSVGEAHLSAPEKGPDVLPGSTNSTSADAVTTPDQASEPLRSVSAQDVTTDSTRPSRTRRLPLRFRDELPVAPHPASVGSSTTDEPSLVRRVILHVFDSIRTGFNTFGIARDYHHRPTYDPDSFVSIHDLSDLPHCPDIDANSANPIASSSVHSPPWPWANMSIWRLMSWKLTGSSQKSNAEVTRLVRDVIQAPDFKMSDLVNFNSTVESKRLENTDPANKTTAIFDGDGWKETTVEISIPTREREGGGQAFSIPGLTYRPLVPVIKAAFSEPLSKFFHLTPFKRIWKSASGCEQRLYDELYTSDTWNKAHDEIQKQRRPDNCQLERVVAGLMIWSDSTQLAQFGHASAWPIYLFFGNLSKYIRASPLVSGACHPIAFIPRIPESLTNIVTSLSRKKNNADILAHCKRELFHAIWRILLDEEFLEAYKNGIVIKCYDGKFRRVYPRVFTYSADYPEKILLATIRDKGVCPCPRCMVPKSKFGSLGLVNDMKARLSQLRTYLRSKIASARELIYNFGVPVKGVAVERLLKEYSLVPTLNAFMERLSPLGFELRPIVVVDFMHELELGVVKNILKHLIRILHCVGLSQVALLNERYSAIPAFGTDTIRRFPDNVANMGRRTARHFEDMLQCAIPVFDGLFPEKHDGTIRVLLFRLAEWHALAKLRLHSDDSLKLLDQSLQNLSGRLRHFVNVTCTAFETKELPSEIAARQRRQQAQAEGSSATNIPSLSSPRIRRFNMLTYKFHALGDYVNTIKTFGTTDSYTTQIGELSHRLIKKFYGLTSKRDTGKQLARQERRFTHVRRQQQASDPSELDKYEASEMDAIPELHHVLTHSPNNIIDLRQLLRDLRAQGDPAIKDDFIPQLKDHILSRLYQYDHDGGEHHFTMAQRTQLRFTDELNRVIESGSFRVNYTSYDIRRKQDYMRPGPDCVVMTLSCEDSPDSHPFWYAQILRAFVIPFVHAAPDARNRSPQTMEVLWVRWLGVVPGYIWGFKVARLPKIGFVPEQDNEAFGFLDPSLVIRRCHVIPVFSAGHTNTLLRRGKSIARRPGDVDDWSQFYVNIFADRDMFTRFAGIGVGHMAQYHRSNTKTDDEDSDDLLNASLDDFDDCTDSASIMSTAEVEQRGSDVDEEGGRDEEEDCSEEEDGDGEEDEDEDEWDDESEDSDEWDFEF